MSKVICVQTDIFQFVLFSPEDFAHRPESLRNIPKNIVKEYNRIEGEWAKMQNILQEYYEDGK